ncbi:hypothetical protein JW998_05850, partial [candidate division KSB1 bacterium]|nr:hypothetical protein [candidate division KSB1 bacterium]
MKSVSFVLLIMMGVVGVSTSALAAFDRSLEPVIVVGSQLPAFLGKSTDGVRVYAYSGGVWQPMPFQIDDFKAKEGELDEKEIDWEGHETLLSLDEVVFMAK